VAARVRVDGALGAPIHLIKATPSLTEPITCTERQYAYNMGTAGLNWFNIASGSTGNPFPSSGINSEKQSWL